MSIYVTATQIVTFKNNVELALQQTVSKFGPHVTWEQASGKRHELKNLIGSVKPTRGTTRHGDTQYNDTPHDRRWVVQTPFYRYAEMVDEADRLRAGIDLQGAYVRQGAAVMARSVDQAFIEGFYGNAYTGEEGGTIVSFPGANVGAVDVGASSPVGLNIAKLRWARSRLIKNLVDLDAEQRFIALTSVQSDNLLNEVKATSADFVAMGGAPVLVSGKLTGLLGFNFIEVEYGNSGSFDNTALTLDGSGYRRVPVWCKSGYSMAEWGSMYTNISNLPGKDYSTQVYARRFLTGTRNEEGKCLQLLCSEA